MKERSVRSYPCSRKLVTGYLAYARHDKGVADTTFRMLQSVLYGFVEVLRDRPPDEVGLRELQDWVARDRAARGTHQGTPRMVRPAPATVQRDVTILRGFYKWARLYGHVELDVAEGLIAPRVANEQPRPIPKDDWVRLWDHPWSPEHRVLLGLGFFGGLRREEMCRLRCDQVSWEPLTLSHFTRKGGGNDVLHLHTGLSVFASKAAWALPDLTTFTGALGAAVGQDRYVLPWQNPNSLNRVMRDLCRAAKVERYTPHQLRHSTATYLLGTGMPIQIVSRYLNHANIQTTMRYVKAGGDEMGEWLSASV